MVSDCAIVPPFAPHLPCEGRRHWGITHRVRGLRPAFAGQLQQLTA